MTQEAVRPYAVTPDGYIANLEDARQVIHTLSALLMNVSEHPLMPILVGEELSTMLTGAASAAHDISCPHKNKDIAELMSNLVDEKAEAVTALRRLGATAIAANPLMVKMAEAMGVPVLDQEVVGEKPAKRKRAAKQKPLPADIESLLANLERGEYRPEGD